MRPAEVFRRLEVAAIERQGGVAIVLLDVIQRLVPPHMVGKEIAAGEPNMLAF